MCSTSDKLLYVTLGSVRASLLLKCLIFLGIIKYLEGLYYNCSTVAYFVKHIAHFFYKSKGVIPTVN